MAGSVCSFYLVPADGSALPAFKPGQYLAFRFEIHDPRNGERKAVQRCYSLSERPRPDYFRISVKRVPSPLNAPVLPLGLSSSFLHDCVREGARLAVKAPSGSFHLAEGDAAPVVLIAGGIGITPLLSMLNALLHAGSRRAIWLFYGVRNSAEQIMRNHLDTLTRDHSNFHLTVCYSDPLTHDRQGIDYDHRGHLDIGLLRARLRLTRHAFYLCGPPPMMQTLVPALEAWGVAPEDIHYEDFGPASVRKSPTAEPSASENFEVSFSKSGKRVAWSPESASLLELAEASGIPVESGCRSGCCGACQTRLEAGAVEYAREPAVDVDAGHCLLCVTRPKSDLALDL
jgi:ferredoxin-NADP reductase